MNETVWKLDYIDQRKHLSVTRLFRKREDAEKLAFHMEHDHLKKHLTLQMNDKNNNNSDSCYHNNSDSNDIDLFKRALKYLEEINTSNISYEEKNKLLNEKGIPWQNVSEDGEGDENSDMIGFESFCLYGFGAPNTFIESMIIE